MLSGIKQKILRKKPYISLWKANPHQYKQETLYAPFWIPISGKSIPKGLHDLVWHRIDNCLFAVLIDNKYDLSRIYLNPQIMIDFDYILTLEQLLDDNQVLLTAIA